MARIDVVMPQMGESIAEGTLSKWLKKIGDPVKRDEPMFEISTDKVDAEIPAPQGGVLAEILVQEGQTVPVQTVVARLETDGKGAAAAPPPASPPPRRRDDSRSRRAARPPSRRRVAETPRRRDDRRSHRAAEAPRRLSRNVSRTSPRPWFERSPQSTTSISLRFRVAGSPDG
jgi:pyruvate/2-oxoglutarate dehydrogenase complex dihydrolipoamide acyltransferase (E2) component